MQCKSRQDIERLNYMLIENPQVSRMNWVAELTLSVCAELLSLTNLL